MIWGDSGKSLLGFSTSTWTSSNSLDILTSDMDLHSMDSSYLSTLKLNTLRYAILLHSVYSVIGYEPRRAVYIVLVLA